jgi:hypothetical protein
MHLSAQWTIYMIAIRTSACLTPLLNLWHDGRTYLSRVSFLCNRQMELANKALPMFDWPLITRLWILTNRAPGMYLRVDWTVE